MAWYSIIRCCGHTEEIQIYGTNVHGERERKAAFEATRECRGCYDIRIAAERQKASEQASTAAAASGLPALAGSDKQVAWAETIRAERIAAIDTLITEETDRLGRLEAAGRPADLIDRQRQGLAILASLRDFVIAKTSAKWFIDYRSQSIGYLARINGFVVINGGGAHQSVRTDRD